MRLLDLLTSPKVQSPLVERNDDADSDLKRQSVSLDRLMRHRVSRTWSSGRPTDVPPMTSLSRMDPDLGFQTTSSDGVKDIQDRDGDDAAASLELGRMLWSNVNLNSAALSSAAEAASGMDDRIIGQDDRRPSLDGSESDFERDPSVSSSISLQLPVRNLPDLLSTTERDEWNAGIDAGWNSGIDNGWNDGKDAEWNCGIDGEWPDGNRDVIAGDDDDDCFKLFDSDSLQLFNFNFVGKTFDEDSNHCDVYNNIATPSTETTKSTGPPSVESMNDYNIDSLQDLVDCVKSEAAGTNEPAGFDEPKSIAAVDNNFVETKKEYQNRLPWNQDGYRISSSTNVDSEVMKLLLNNTRKIIPHQLQASSSSASVSSLGSKLDAARKRKNNQRDKPNTSKRSKVSPSSESSSIKTHEFSHQQQQMMAGANSSCQNFDSGQRHLAMCIGEQDLASIIDNGMAQSWITSDTSYFDDVTAVQDDVYYNTTISPTGNLVLFLDNFHDLVKLESEPDMTLNLTQLTPEEDVGTYSDTVSTENDIWTSLARYGGNCIKTEPGASEEISDLSTDHDYCQNAMNTELCLRSRLLRFDWSSKDGGCSNEALKNLLLDTNLTEKVKRDAEVVRAKSRKLMTTTTQCDTVDIYSF